VHGEARRFAEENYQIIFIGHEGHEEVEGTMGEAPGNMILVESPDHVAEIDIDESRPLAWLSQTTLSVDETNQTVDRLRERFPQLIDPPSDDICYATQNRQQAVKDIASQCDVMLVVGSANSSNTVRLVDVALEAGSQAAYRIDWAGELDPEWVTDVVTVGLTSGASVPEILVDEVIDWLNERGFSDLEEVTSAEEHLLFALPPELRRDMKAAEAAKS